MLINKSSCITRFLVIILSAFLSACCAGLVAKGTNTEIAMTPIVPYQTEDKNLSCGELNQSLGMLKERTSRLVEENEKNAQDEKANRSFGTHFIRYNLFAIITAPISAIYHSISEANDDEYGSKNARTIQTYQERVNHLEKMIKTNNC